MILTYKSDSTALSWANRYWVAMRSIIKVSAPVVEAAGGASHEFQAEK